MEYRWMMVISEKDAHFAGCTYESPPQGFQYFMDVPQGMNPGRVLAEIIAGRFSQGGWPTRGEAVEEC